MDRSTFPPASNLSSGHNHVGSFSVLKSRTRLAHDVMYTGATRSWLIDLVKKTAPSVVFLRLYNADAYETRQ